MSKPGEAGTVPRLSRVISGGQTGVDQAALAAARRAGLETGGWVPKGWLTEAGPAPWLERYGLREMPSADYPRRTVKNVQDSDATLWLGDPASTGGRLTCETTRRRGKPLYVANPLAEASPSAVAAWYLALPAARILNVAGNRESVEPGIGERAERFLSEFFELLRSRSDPEES